jgi:membrane protease YdiL (CAAX protease family)
MSPSPVRDVVLPFAVITAVTVLVSVAGRWQPLDEYVPALVGGLFLFAAVHLSQRQPDGLTRYGLRLAGLLEPPEQTPDGAVGALMDLGRALWRALPLSAREIGVALGVGAIVFPPFVLGFFLFHEPKRPFALQLPAGVVGYVLTQVLVVGIPEEALFRGYFQGRLSDRFARRTRLLGADVSLPAFLLQAGLFALIHVAVDLNPARLAVFFPALLFGWLRERRGGIGAAAVLHALCNLLSDVLFRSWL